jgi:hypothetical protein
MGLFSKTPPQPATTDLTLAQFAAKAKAMPPYRDVANRFGPQLSELMLQALYDRNLRMMTPAGVWANGAPNYAPIAAPASLVKLKPGDLPSFDMILSESLRQDVVKTDGRIAYLDEVKAKAVNGELRTALLANLADEATYYSAPVAAPGAPALPPKPAASVNRAKAIGWASGSRDLGIKSIYGQVINAYAGAGFPLTGMSDLNAIWRRLVTAAPHYRAVNIMTPTKYPSSLAGDFIVRARIADFRARAQPQAGAQEWYDWALYFFAVIMTSQAFTDGNKRVARTVYALTLLNGAVPFLAPNATLGARLGDM